MAGAGYKLFNTGDVLTAAQVNTYLMEQTVMVFADAAARTTALTGVVSEGMLSYLKDTNVVEVYNGSAWVSSDDPNAIQNSIINAKGDLIAGSANDTPAILAVGSNYAFLQADSAESTGIKWNLDTWTSWTPTVSSTSGTITSTTTTFAKYIRVGKICIAKFQINITNAGTGSGGLKITLPFNSAADNGDNCVGAFRENNNTGNMGQIRIFGSSDATLAQLLFYNNTTPIATNNNVGGTFTYEVA